MMEYLEERAGAMDYGKFSNAFPGIKKTQLEPHFSLHCEGDNSSGRWQITLQGIDPLTPEERAAQDQQERSLRAQKDERKDERKEKERGRDPPLHIQPSGSMRLTGYIKHWVRKKDFGFIVTSDDTHGDDLPPPAEKPVDIFVHRNDLPPEVQHWKGNFAYVECTFEMFKGHQDTRPKAKNIHLLIESDPQKPGNFRFRKRQVEGASLQEDEGTLDSLEQTALGEPEAPVDEADPLADAVAEGAEAAQGGIYNDDADQGDTM
jgi:cold shock CspA family protein